MKDNQEREEKYRSSSEAMKELVQKTKVKNKVIIEQAKRLLNGRQKEKTDQIIDFTEEDVNINDEGSNK